MLYKKYFYLIFLFTSFVSSSYLLNNFVNNTPKYNEINWIDLKSNIREKKYVKKIEIVNNNRNILVYFFYFFFKMENILKKK